MRKLLGVKRAPIGHWVGDGFPVRSLFTPADSAHLSPFLLLDYAAPRHFEPATRPRGVGVHPHRGFETVTLVFQGEVAHRDSAGNGGVIGAGDVQWMTAGSGILHQEMPKGDANGRMHGFQLWANLPSSLKMTPPRYQEIKSGETLAVVEAMKMENILRAERDGTIKKVRVKPGDSVAVDAVIMEFA